MLESTSLKKYSDAENKISSVTSTLVSGYARWLGCWSLAGRLCLTCAKSVVDR